MAGVCRLRTLLATFSSIFSFRHLSYANGCDKESALECSRASMKKPADDGARRWSGVAWCGVKRRSDKEMALEHPVAVMLPALALWWSHECSHELFNDHVSTRLLSPLPAPHPLPPQQPPPLPPTLLAQDQHH